MTRKTDWGWWWSWTGETFTGPEPSREAAIAAAREHESGLVEICEARRLVFSAADLVPSVDDMIEEWLNDNEDLIGEEGDNPFDRLTAAEKNSLSATLRRAAAEWHEMTGVRPRPAWAFIDTRNHETVDLDAEEAAP